MVLRRPNASGRDVSAFARTFPRFPVITVFVRPNASGLPVYAVPIRLPLSAYMVDIVRPNASVFPVIAVSATPSPVRLRVTIRVMIVFAFIE